MKLLAKVKYCPTEDKIFRAFEIPLDKVRVVILGQDPYPNPQHAIGLAFAVPQSVQAPLSLQIIIDEIALTINNPVLDIEINGEIPYPFNTELTDWVNQGVLLLNSALTVEENKPGSHLKWWEGFIKVVFKRLSEKDNIIWMLWGSYARNFKTLITNESHYILEHSHPAASRFGLPFKECRHFREANSILQSLDQPIIDWNSN